MASSAYRDEMYRAIVEGDAATIVGATNRATEAGEPPLVLIHEVLNPALKEVGDKFDTGEIFLPELIMSAEAMEAAVAILEPLLEERNEEIESPGRVVMATPQGDIHDIGKNIVAALLKANGFTVLDLGRDVPPADIVTKAEDFEADIIGLSALLSTTLPYCVDTLRLLEEKGLQGRYHVFIGGGAVTPEYAQGVGARYGGAHAEEGVRNMLLTLGKA